MQSIACIVGHTYGVRSNISPLYLTLAAMPNHIRPEEQHYSTPAEHSREVRLQVHSGRTQTECSLNEDGSAHRSAHRSAGTAAQWLTARAALMPQRMWTQYWMTNWNVFDICSYDLAAFAAIDPIDAITALLCRVLQYIHYIQYITGFALTTIRVNKV